MNEVDRGDRLQKLLTHEGSQQNESFVGLEALADAFIALYDECSLSTQKKDKKFSSFLEWAKDYAVRLKYYRLSKDEFDIVKIIGQGAFGQVAVCKNKLSGKVFAMKTLNKHEMISRAETACYKEERDVLVFGDQRWITKLHFAFQDTINLYLIMDYYPGGDLLTLLSKYEDKFPEDMARFYAAEMTLAIHALHTLGYAHRDIKPDNVLLHNSGHIRLADFGSCLKLHEDGLVHSNVAVGTPDYISPEILRAQEDGMGRYGAGCDWWSLGVVVFEMLFGETPFYAESLVETYGRIMNHEDSFKYPDDVQVSEEAKDLLLKFLCKAEKRFGKNGLGEIKEHPWFANSVDFDTIHTAAPPYHPDIKGPEDTSNFDIDETDIKRLQNSLSSRTLPSVFSGESLPFIGFTFTSTFKLNDKNLRLGTETTSGSQEDLVDTHMTNGFSGANLQHLKADKEKLEKKCSELTAALDKARNHERINTLLRQEKVKLKDDLENLYNQMGQQSKELREALQAKKLASQDHSDMTLKLSDAQKEKQKLMRVLRDKDEELEELNAKVDQMSTQLRTANADRRKLENELDDSKLELNREKRLRMTYEEDVKRLEGDLDSAQERMMQRTPGVNEYLQENQKLKQVMEQNAEEHSNEMKKLENRMEEVSAELSESESSRADLKKDLLLLKHNLDSTREQLVDRETRLSRLQSDKSQLLHQVDKYEIQIKSLMETCSNFEAENKKLNQKVSVEEEFDKDVESIARWVNDEKESRQYLEDLTRLLKDDMDQLKQTVLVGATTPNKRAGGGDDITWQQRRNNKVDKKELLQLTSSLDHEIKAKEEVTRELNEAREKVMTLEEKLDDYERELDILREHMNYCNNNNEFSTDPENDMRDALNGVDNGYLTINTCGTVSRNVSDMSFLHFLNDPMAALGQKYPETSSAVGAVDYSPRMQTPVRDNEDAESMNHRQSMSPVADVSHPGAPPIPAKVPLMSQHQLSVNTNASDSQSSLTPIESAQFQSSQHGSNRPFSTNRSVSSPTGGSTMTNHMMMHSPRSVTSQTQHKFEGHTLLEPTKCCHCMSLMLGLARQAVKCTSCSFMCHPRCVESLQHSICPMPAEQMKSHLGIDPQTGIGTAYEGYVKIPRSGGGVKKGWVRQYAVTCDYKFFLFDCVENGGKSLSNSSSGSNSSQGSSGSVRKTLKITECIDMKDENFSVSSVTQNDVIHASRKDLPCIFKICGSSTRAPTLTKHTVLCLCDSEEKCNKWIAALRELYSLLNKHNLLAPPVLEAKEVLDNSLSLLKFASCATLIDPNRIAIGAEEGLFCVNLLKDTICKLGDSKKVVQVEIIKSQSDSLHSMPDSFVILSGKTKQLKLFPTSVLDGHELDVIKIPDSKNCSLFTMGQLPPHPTTGQSGANLLCFAVKNNVYTLEVSAKTLAGTKLTPSKLTVLPGNVQWMRLLDSGKVLCGYPSGFATMNLNDKMMTPEILVNPTDRSLGFLVKSQLDALAGHATSENTYFLCFSRSGLVVDNRGNRCFAEDLQWPIQPSHVVFSPPDHVISFSPQSVDVFDVHTMNWLQTIPLKKSTPLTSDGKLVLCGGDVPKIVYLHNKSKHGAEEVFITSAGLGKSFTSTGSINGGGSSSAKSRRRFSFTKTKDDEREQLARALKNLDEDKKSKLISGPTNFSHVSHMGPTAGLPILRDLNVNPHQVTGSSDIIRMNSMILSTPARNKMMANMNSTNSSQTAGHNLVSVSSSNAGHALPVTQSSSTGISRNILPNRPNVMSEIIQSDNKA
ncbi:serine/threonine-protein kinase Genghis Khan-like isoform X3 [Symsagittifera roscoffensis]|uniref:serine/threonine-protein kinase Genghis Khan-like isoform X3 n=1 Tax=Symsagittifera roscoffensis TaxID=84072 RepID=UPI00307BFAEA